MNKKQSTKHKSHYEYEFLAVWSKTNVKKITNIKRNKVIQNKAESLPKEQKYKAKPNYNLSIDSQQAKPFFNSFNLYIPINNNKQQPTTARKGINQSVSLPKDITKRNQRNKSMNISISTTYDSKSRHFPKKDSRNPIKDFIPLKTSTITKRKNTTLDDTTYPDSNVSQDKIFQDITTNTTNNVNTTGPEDIHIQMVNVFQNNKRLYKQLSERLPAIEDDNDDLIDYNLELES